MNIGLDSSVLDKLETYEDFLSFFIELEEESSSFSWQKADLLHELVKKHGEASIESLSQAIKRPRSTISIYVRTAKAFPPDKRIPGLPFTMYLEASFSDSYDKKEKKFLSDNRFDWIKEAADGEWSARKLKQNIKSGKTSGTEIPLKCMKCGGELGVYQYLLYRTEKRQNPITLELDEGCMTDVLKYAKIISK